MTIYKHAASSSTSFSDDDIDDDERATMFYAGSNRQPLAAAPAQWSLKSTPTFHSAAKGSPISTIPAEILIQILKNLHNTRDLLNCLRVSRRWCECSVELLWHKPGFPHASTLQKMIRCLSRSKQTFTYAKFIRRLNLLSQANIITDDILSVFAKCDRMERFTIVNCENITSKCLLRTLPAFPNLIAVDLSGVVNANDAAVIAFAETARGLQGINLNGCSQVTDVGILACARNCPMLRRVKLSGVTQLTDASITALAKSCPLLLELDLNYCSLISDISLREIWVRSTYMRELRVSHCVNLTDAAFPSVKVELGVPREGPNPFPSQDNYNELPPLRLLRPLEHLRMLDLTACSLITDDAIDGITSYALKIRNLVLSKCGLLTDCSVINICRLGRHLHYLHLGHVSRITDSSVRTLARSCTRLRYVDFANCSLLTDMSVFELSALPKLRRIGLVRVSNLTDEAIYALGDRHTSLERIHLSYCDQISVMAIHFLLQKLHKLTHLSLTGIPSFRQPELQKFCREPPKNFNSNQALAFCVYSGKGVADLRTFLIQLFDHITEMDGTDDTEYEEDEVYNAEESQEQEEAEEEDEEEEGNETFEGHLHNGDQARQNTQDPPQPPPSHEFIFPRDRTMRAATIPPSGYAHSASSSGTARPRRGESSSMCLSGQAYSGIPSHIAEGSSGQQAYPSSSTSRRYHGHIQTDPSVADLLPIVESSSGSSQNHASGCRQSHHEVTSAASQTQPSTSALSLEQTPTISQDHLPYNAQASTSTTSRARTQAPSPSTPAQDDRGRAAKRNSFRETLNAAEHSFSSFLFGRSKSHNEGPGPNT